MRSSNVSFLWRNAGYTRPFRTGVCLHGHTMHSEECLSFLPRYLHRVPGVSQIVSRYQRGPRPAVDFSRAYWTPPLSPASALHLEHEQITQLGLHPLVSLTDHDNIEAGVTLQETENADEVPVSVEWTVPFSGSIFHLGIHNLPPAEAQSWMSAMMAYTDTPDERLLRAILCALAEIPQVLVVLNHPFWLEEGIEEAVHQPALDRFLREHLRCLHAFELNGTRKWTENAAVMELARDSLPARRLRRRSPRLRASRLPQSDEFPNILRICGGSEGRLQFDRVSPAIPAAHGIPNSRSEL